ncbi:MAG TPA: glutamate--tRNA ligase [Candidatus Azoamicus sp. OHIO2]
MIRTRFAPSPTGYMHLGNIRTAFFSWLFAKKNIGKFYLRIDDTDSVRNSQKYVNNILDILKWLDIKYDGNIIFQSNNFSIYKKFAEQLLIEEKAYKCFCSKERLNLLRIYQLKNKLRVKYDEHCRYASYFNNKPFTVRFKNITPDNITVIHDSVKGDIKVSNNEFDDFIILKDNFLPTYNFASVVDDICYNITHIIRGDDHISNTVKQMNLMLAFNFKIPVFAHLPMILDENKKVLSKRNHIGYANFYKINGFLPIAVLNYIIRLGLSFQDKEIFSLDEMIKFFEFININKSPASLNYKKLLYLNKYYMKLSSFRYILQYFLPIEKKFNLNYFYSPCIKDLITICKYRSGTLREIIIDHIFLYQDIVEFNVKSKNFFIILDVISHIIKMYNDLKSKTFDWTIENVKYYIKTFLESNNLTMASIARTLRIILTGSDKPHSLYEIFFLSGRILILKKFRTIIKVSGL